MCDRHCVFSGRILDAAIVTAAAVFVLSVVALIGCCAMTLLERWTPHRASAAFVTPDADRRPILFDQDAELDALRAS
jgi:hypothetical protein